MHHEPARPQLQSRIAVFTFFGFATLAALPHPSEHVVRPSLTTLCATEEDGRLVSVSCDAYPIETASNTVRHALGAPYCWWTVTAAELEDVNGVGEVVAGRLIEARPTLGATPMDHLTEVRGVGPTLAERIRTHVTDRCSGSVEERYAKVTLSEETWRSDTALRDQRLRPGQRTPWLTPDLLTR